MLKGRVLAIFERQKGRLVTGGDLARQLEVTRTAVWKSVRALRESGYAIESVAKRGYRFLSGSDVLSERAIREGLKTTFLGNRIEVLKTVDSTNTYMKKKDLAHTEEGLVVIADGQTGGRGRKGRTFHSPAGEGLYLSLLLKPDVAPGDSRLLTLCAALAVCGALESVCGVVAGVKWVNDIYCKGKKLCGILTEGAVSVEAHAMAYVVVGIGINTGTVCEEAREVAVSVGDLTGLRPDRNALAAALLNRLEGLCRLLQSEGGRRELVDAYRKRLFFLGETVEVLAAEGRFFAVAEGIDDDGNLIVRSGEGKTLRLCAEEISLRLLGSPDAPC